MLTLESTYREFIELCVRNGGCSNEGGAIPVMIKAINMMDNPTILDGIKQYLSDKSMPELWMEWVFPKIGLDLDIDVRKMFLLKITNPVVASKILKCEFLTREEIEYLELIAKDEGITQKLIDNITDPVEAAHLLIDHPYLTNVQELTLKAKFEEKLPTIEKELLIGTVVTAKSIELAKVK